MSAEDDDATPSQCRDDPNLDPIDPAAIGRLLRIGEAPLLRRIVDLYVSEAPLRLSAIAAAVAAQDRGATEAAAHSLKSMAANVGATRVFALCERIEGLARSALSPGVVEAAAALPEAHRRACAALAELRPSAG